MRNDRPPTREGPIAGKAADRVIAARVAAQALARACGDPLAYLVLRAGDETAWPLASDAVRAFVEEDVRQGGPMCDTVLAYVVSCSPSGTADPRPEAPCARPQRPARELGAVTRRPRRGGPYVAPPMPADPSTRRDA
jgi:hypothetical protein